jgi:hypothetical protein
VLQCDLGCALVDLLDLGVDAGACAIAAPIDRAAAKIAVLRVFMIVIGFSFSG